MKCSLGISNFLEEISSLSYSVVFLSFFAYVSTTPKCPCTRSWNIYSLAAADCDMKHRIVCVRAADKAEGISKPLYCCGSE